MSAAYTITREGRGGRTWRERRVMRGIENRPSGSGECPRCSGRGYIYMPGLGRGGMNVGGLHKIDCPACKGGRL
jgi:hypothetical protein